MQYGITVSRHGGDGQHILSPQKAGSGLPDVNDPIVDLGVGEVTNNLSWTWYLV